MRGIQIHYSWGKMQVANKRRRAMIKSIQIGSGALAILLAIAACNLPSSTPGAPDAAASAATQTAQAQLSQNAPLPITATASATLPPTNTVVIPPSAVPATATSNCDAANFVDDITIPDGADMSPGQNFTKTWRIKNVGTCSWTPSYTVVFSSGASMSGPATQALPGNVNPGQTIDISIALTAPSTNGNYKGYWKLRNASGVLFSQFYVDIDVVSSGSGGSGFDLHSQAPSAQWIGSAGVVTFGGPDTDPNGFALYKDGSRLEG